MNAALFGARTVIPDEELEESALTSAGCCPRSTANVSIVILGEYYLTYWKE